MRCYDDIFDNRHFSRREELSPLDWASILKLSTLWQFEEVRRTAIENLTPSKSHDPIQTILLAKVYNVTQWYASGLRSLVERKDLLTVDEVNQLGLELGLKVTQMHGKVEGFKIAESRFNQAILSMTSSFTYDDFWDTVVTNPDDWLLPAISRSPSRPMISSPKPSSSFQSISVTGGASPHEGLPESKPCTEYSLSAGLRTPQPGSPSGLTLSRPPIQQSNWTDVQPVASSEYGKPCSPIPSPTMQVALQPEPSNWGALGSPDRSSSPLAVDPTPWDIPSTRPSTPKQSPPPSGKRKKKTRKHYW